MRAVKTMQVAVSLGVFFALWGCAASKRPARAPQNLPEGSYIEEGLASWYGPGFHGRKTASGERFNSRDLTCAHPTLPFGSKLKVINLINGNEVLVTVNDRGPFIRPRIIDLSFGAAELLDFIREGTTLVRIEAAD
jgi:rare lipoprotein A